MTISLIKNIEMCIRDRSRRNPNWLRIWNGERPFANVFTWLLQNLGGTVEADLCWPDVYKRQHTHTHTHGKLIFWSLETPALGNVLRKFREQTRPSMKVQEIMGTLTQKLTNNVTHKTADLVWMHTRKQWGKNNNWCYNSLLSLNVHQKPSPVIPIWRGGSAAPQSK